MVSSLIRFALKSIHEHSRTAEVTKKPDLDPAGDQLLRLSDEVPIGSPDQTELANEPSDYDYPCIQLPANSVWSPLSCETAMSIKKAPWKVVAIKTASTATPYGAPASFVVNEMAEGWDGRPRVRALVATWPTESGSLQKACWDLDTIDRDQRTSLTDALLSGVLIGFDTVTTLNWLQHTSDVPGSSNVSLPDRVIDLLSVARVVRPQIPVELQIKAADDDVARELVALGGSGWSLPAITHVLLTESTSSTVRHKHREWCSPALLSDRFATELTNQLDGIRQCFAKLLGCEVDSNFVASYDRFVSVQPEHLQSQLQRLETLPLSLAKLHSNGAPFDSRYFEEYQAELGTMISEQADLLITEVPGLSEHRGTLLDSTKGLSESIKAHLGRAFESRGLKLKYTNSRPPMPKLGEKDLRGAGASKHEKTSGLFSCLSKLNKAKKRLEMAKRLAEFASRGKDARVHSTFTPSTGTMRLSCSDPNLQAMPGEPEFRGLIAADPGHSIVACDFNALDVRVGAALAIRTQRLWVECLRSNDFGRLTRDQQCLNYLAEAMGHDAPGTEADASHAVMDRYKDQWVRERKWPQIDSLRKKIVAYRAVAAWRTIEPRAQDSADGCWGGLREGFQLDADSHTYTAMKLSGQDPKSLLHDALGENSSPDQRIEWWEQQTLQMGEKRKRGKVANLELLYGMTLQGFIEDSARKFDEHWDLEEARSIYTGWYRAYPEIDLMNCIIEMQAITTDSDGKRLFGYRLKDEGKGRVKPLQVFRCRTLSGRTLYAEGLNAGLNYGNQGTGADILTAVMTKLRQTQPQAHGCLINQVHDELVAMAPDSHARDVEIAMKSTMEQSGAALTEPYGVPMKVSSSVEKVWMK